MAARGRETAHTAREGVEGSLDSPWLTTGLAAAYCRIHPNTSSDTVPVTEVVTR